MNTKQLLVEAVEAAEMITSLNKRCLVVKKLAFNKSSKAIDDKTREILEESVHYCCKVQKNNLKKISILLEDAEEEINDSDMTRQLIPIIKRISSNIQDVIYEILRELNNQEKLKIESYTQGNVLIQRELKLYKRIEALREDAIIKFGLIVKKYKKYLGQFKEKLMTDVKHAKIRYKVVLGIAGFFGIVSLSIYALAGARVGIVQPTNSMIYYAFSMYIVAVKPSINEINNAKKELKHHMKKISKKFTWFIHSKIKKVNKFYSKISKL